MSEYEIGVSILAVGCMHLTVSEQSHEGSGLTCLTASLRALPILLLSRWKWEHCSKRREDIIEARRTSAARGNRLNGENTETTMKPVCSAQINLTDTTSKFLMFHVHCHVPGMYMGNSRSRSVRV